MGERELVNVIADEHDLSELLSSISENGYFHSEPLIGALNKQKGARITIVEGNRRLAACLLLAGDKRAADQNDRRRLYLPSRFKAGDKLPVFVYDWENPIDRRQLLPYLGIRHIVGPLQWDSYAKAAWIASAIDSARPSQERAVEKLQDAADLAEETFGLLLGITADEVPGMLPPANRPFQAAREIRERLRKVQDGREDVSDVP